MEPIVDSYLFEVKCPKCGALIKFNAKDVFPKENNKERADITAMYMNIEWPVTCTSCNTISKIDKRKIKFYGFNDKFEESNYYNSIYGMNYKKYLKEKSKIKRTIFLDIDDLSEVMHLSILEELTDNGKSEIKLDLLPKENKKMLYEIEPFKTLHNTVIPNRYTAVESSECFGFMYNPPIDDTEVGN